MHNHLDGQPGPQDGQPGPQDGQPRPQGDLPNDPLKYSQPKFTATWQVYPGMYQPGLRVMADTGMGVAEWLRHLGQPNPLPTIEQPIAPGQGARKEHSDDEQVGGGRKKRKL